jgi:polyketide cyclase/dehydrase/lipid transport protein
MRSLEAAIEIRASPEAIFDLIHDYARRLEWDPFLKEHVFWKEQRRPASGSRPGALLGTVSLALPWRRSTCPLIARESPR